ncbi:MAG: hypothetical protein AAFN10_07790 [Bacteroidota bacterium]
MSNRTSLSGLLPKGTGIFLLFFASMLFWTCQPQGYRTYRVKVPSDKLKKDFSRQCTLSFPSEKTLRIEVGPEIVLHTNAYDWLAKLLEKRKSGITVELVSAEPYACFAERFPLHPYAERTKRLRFKGPICKPLYRKQLLSAFEDDKEQFEADKAKQIKWLKDQMANGSIKAIKKKQELESKRWQPPMLSFSLGPNPLYGDGKTEPYEVNLLYLYKNRICKIRHSGGPCGERYSDIEPLSLLEKYHQDSIIFPETNRLDTFQIQFAPGSAEIPVSQIEAAIASMIRDSSNLLSVKVNAYSSVEGDEDDNDCLAGKRAGRLKRWLTQYTPSQIGTAVPIYTETRWDMFYEQLKDYTGRLPQRKNKAWNQFLRMNPDKRKEFEPLLAQQRIAEIIFEFKVVMNRRQQRDYLLSEFQKAIKLALVDSSRTDRFDYSYVRRALSLQNQMFQALSQMSVPDQRFFTQNIPILTGYGQLAFNQWEMQRRFAKKGILSRGEESVYDIQDIKQMVDSLVKLEPTDKLWRYNQLVLQINEFGALQQGNQAPNPDTLYYAIDSMSVFGPQLTGSDFPKMWINYHFQVANYLIGSVEFKKNRLYSLKQIYGHYAKTQISEAKALRLSKFFTKGGASQEALAILKPHLEAYAKQEKAVNEDLYAFALMITYLHPDQTPDGENSLPHIAKASKMLSPEKWCALFKNQCALGFQALDNADIQKVYCEQCIGELDYIRKSPSAYKR